MKHVLNEFEPGDYGVILVSAGIDRYQHNQVFSNELDAAFNAHGVKIKQIDYITEIRPLAESFLDRKCKFFVCFNGFGSELSMAVGELKTVSAFEYRGKPLIDLMHDCPIHETMVHQLSSVGAYRNLLMTDYNYAFIARLLGIRNTRFVPSITFPLTIGNAPEKRFHQRSIDILLPIGLSNAEIVRGRHAHAFSHKDRVYKEIFESVVSLAIADLRVDPLVEALVALREIHSAEDLASRNVIYLISSILDFVKFQRRKDLVNSVRHLPITVITDHDLNAEFPGNAMRSQASGSFAQLLHTMTDSKSVICPLPHHTGFHERAMGAFCAGAYVVAAPNEVLETNFAQEKEMVIYRDNEELASLLESMLSEPDTFEEAAMAGHRKAMARFSPANLVSSMLTALSLHAKAA